MAEHVVVKPQKIVETGIGLLEQELKIPGMFMKQGFDQFKGAEGDTVNVKVDGFLPGHDYKFRADRDVANTAAEPHEGELKMDEYSERTIPISLSGRGYSGVLLTDEQNDFDNLTVQDLMRVQAKAVARMVNYGAVRELENAPYEVVIGGAEANLRGATTEARRVLNRFNVPEAGRVLIVGSDYEAAMLNDDKIVLAQNVGDARADSAIGQAVLGTVNGFTVVSDTSISPTSAYATFDAAFVLANAAPYVPNSVPFGATASFEGIALRWLRDYEARRLRDRSILDTYYGFRPIKDLVVGYDSSLKREYATQSEHFVRGIKLNLEGASDYPADATDLAQITGITDAAVWTPTGPAGETDPANTGA